EQLLLVLQPGVADTCLYVKKTDKQMSFIAIYVDNEFSQIRTTLEWQFKLSTLGELRQFLGIHIEKVKGHYHLNQRSYIEKLLGRRQICRRTRRTVCWLYVAVNSRPDICIETSLLCRKVSNPSNRDWTEAKRTLKYLKGTKDLRLHLGNGDGLIIKFGGGVWNSHITDSLPAAKNSFQTTHGLVQTHPSFGKTGPSALPLTVGSRASSSPQLASGIPSITNPNSRSPFRQPLCARTSVPELAAKENHRGSATINLPSRTTPCWKLQAGRGGRSERPKRFDSKLVDTYFDDVGGMAKILREFLLHVKQPECRLRVDLCSGQTLLAHAIAGQLKIGLATKLVAELARRKSKAVTRCSSSVPPTGRMRLNRACVASVALTRKSRSEFRSAKRAQILKIICKNLKLEQTMDYDENANLALGYVAAVTTAIKRMLTERERQQLLVERRKTDQDRLKQLAKKVVVDDKVMNGGIGEPASVHSCTSVTAELRSNPSLPARTRVPELAVEYYTVLRAQAKGATNLVAGVSSKSEQRIQDIQEVFNQATVLSPCLLFFDDINAISANRVTAQKDMERQIVAQLLCSLDGLCESKKVTRCSSSVLPTGGMRSTRPCVAPVALNRKSGSKLRSAKRALRIWKSPNSRRPSTTTNSPVTSEQLCWRWSPARPRTLTAVGRGHSRALSGNPAPQSGTGMTQATCQEGRRR
ncbi:uncharacterized protein LOC120428490, partial [Culex pipiens pallens]|uniref:uncharacterized protein LOC120428490 n=1 Tax=Culex pipiens pallens TaxID=42434 RepID=UPI0022AA0A0F